MTAQHTPIPWVKVSHSGTVHDSQGRFIADVRDPNDYLHLTDVTEANAEFIVRAVNSHALMEKALKDIRDEVGRKDGGGHAVCMMIVHRFWREYEGDTNAGGSTRPDRGSVHTFDLNTAAAPLMLEALKAVESVGYILEEWSEGGKALAKVLSAIRAATGEDA